MRSKSHQLTGIGEIFDRMRLPKSVRDHLKSHRVWAKWAEIVGPDLSRVTAPVELKTKVLVVHVIHQAWAQQLHFLKHSILAKIRALGCDSDIKDLQFRVGKVSLNESHSSDLSPEARFQTRKNSDSIKLTERQELTLRAVEDPDLRASIRRAMEAQACRPKN